ncbi:hypothetical protein J8TS2_14130 [Lederbergia ruris]|uniref:Uncharacterized protein n=1 Tax=Lederbergia ruris TaxID=217495 RepID=A0ABQ4KGK3_9BACI|nr:hypothetical protein J8TS2_14130 [Lederbergia ruris]
MLIHMPILLNKKNTQHCQSHPMFRIKRSVGREGGKAQVCEIEKPMVITSNNGLGKSGQKPSQFNEEMNDRSPLNKDY